MLNLIAAGATYLFPGGRALKLVKDGINVTNSTNPLILTKNFGIELSSQEVPLQVLSSIYNVSQLSSRWISVVPLSTLKTPKQK